VREGAGRSRDPSSLETWSGQGRIKRDAGGMDGEEGGGAGILVVEKNGKAQRRVPFPIRQALNPGWQILCLRLLLIFLY